MIWQVRDSGLLPGRANMEADEVMARQLEQGLVGPSLRLYGWRPYALSLGFHQSALDVDTEALAANGIDLVRRPTGGKAILHAREVTYCVVMKYGELSPKEIYRFINECLIRGLELLGIREVPRSGKPSELMHAHGIDAAAIVAAVKRLLA